MQSWWRWWPVTGDVCDTVSGRFSVFTQVERVVSTHRQILTRLSQPPDTKRLTGVCVWPTREPGCRYGPQLTALQPIYRHSFTTDSAEASELVCQNTTNIARRRSAADSQSHDTHSVIICEIRSLFKPPQLHVFQRLHTSHRCDL